MAANAAERLVLWRTRIGRTAAGPALVRLVAGLAFLGAVMVTFPASIAGAAGLSVGAVLGAFVGLFPRTRFVGLAGVIVVLGSVISVVGFPDMSSPTWARLLGVSALLYLGHSTAALAAVLPYDSAVAPSLLMRWLGRSAAVLAVSIGGAGAAVLIVELLVPVRSVIGPIVGSMVAAGLVALIAWQVRRRST